MNPTSRVTRELCKVVGVQQSHTTHTILMGNGMAERFNQMLIRMISILDDKQNKDWTIQIISLVHAYNTTKHDSICYILVFLMFGRHPPLSIDAYLCIDIETSEKSNSYDNHSKKLEKRIDFAYSIVFREVKLELYGINTVSRKVR